ncbi:peptidyl-alpha-hydroxyglycine alpha-amidating lyase family protein [Acidisphaera sp. S103]|uniref:peptidyl-alpha-hydroxyglycine alpha-amidating lyase family protein n=1 Tax=Acidisphaera sp. S103 TaxID=1747223 RepID=UPI00131E8AA0|nr:peptidyl-alpha-hydroxyglycine alpha-amidating lyase family protein [Acidisphaera sp. S103]
MTAIVGSGDFKFRVEPGWAKLPDDWDLKDVGGVAVDKQDRVFVFNRGDRPMIVLDRDGTVLKTWGETIFNRPHAVHLTPDGTIWCADEGDHVIHRCTLDGAVLSTLGTKGAPAPEFSGQPFNRPTQTALTPDGDILVADGYGNARVHKYGADGRWKLSWGDFGTDPGQFNVVHNITCDDDGFVYIADRENYRIQVFDTDGKFVTQWHNLFRPCGLYMHGTRQPIFFVGELGPFLAINRRYPNIGPRISVLDHKGQLLGRLGAPHAGTEDGAFIAPHTLAMDSRGDLYVGEVSYSAWEHVFPGAARPRRIRSLQKLVRIS